MGNVYGVSLLVHLLIHYLFVDRIFKKKKKTEKCAMKSGCTKMMLKSRFKIIKHFPNKILDCLL